jgi:uncharacterized membrane protein YkoI
MNLKGSDINVVCNAIVGAMMNNGYLTETSNSVLLSVRANDPERGKEIEKEVSDSLNGFLEKSDISPAIFGQYVEDDEDLDNFAGENAISTGKAWLIRKLTESEDSHLTEDELLSLSTQELILLGEDLQVSTGTSHGTPDTSKYVSSDAALTAALMAAGMSKYDAEFVKVSFGCDNGSIVYEVKFNANYGVYRFKVDAVTGKVIEPEHRLPGVSFENNEAADETAAADKTDAPAVIPAPAPSNNDNTDSTKPSGGEGSGDSGEISGDIADIEDEPSDIDGDVTDIADEPEPDEPDSSVPEIKDTDEPAKQPAAKPANDTAKEDQNSNSSHSESENNENTKED